MRLFPGTELIRCIVFILLATKGLCLAQTGDPIGAPPGVEMWEALEGEKPDSFVPVYDRRHLATDGQYVAVLSGAREVLVFDVTDGSLKHRAPKPAGVGFSIDSHLHIEGGTIYYATKESGATQGTEKVTLSALDPVTGLWKWNVSKNVTGASMFGQGPSVSIGLHAGEIRVCFITGQIARWRLSDRFSLPTLYFKEPGNPYTAQLDSVVGATLNGKFCVGVSTDKRRLVLESGGKFTHADMPGFQSTTQGSYALSKNYLVLRVRRSDTDPDQGFVVWNRTKAGAGAVEVRLVSSEEPVFQIYQDRYLMAIVREQSTGLQKLHVIDLTMPNHAGPVVTLPEGMPAPVAMGVRGKDFWFFAEGEVFAFGRMAGLAGETFATVGVDDVRGAEASGKLSFKVRASGKLTKPVTVHLKARSGTATEGVDFEPYEGTVTLTSSAPVKWVDVTLLNDGVPESFESLLLEVTSVDGAWPERRFASGVITGSGLRKIGTISAPPGAGQYYRFDQWAMTQVGVVAVVGTYPDPKKYYLRRTGEDNWTAIAPFNGNPAVLPGDILDVRGNLVALFLNEGPYYAPTATKLVVVNVDTNQVVSEIPVSRGSGGDVALGENGFTIYENFTWTGYGYGNNTPLWTRSSSTGDGFTSNSSYITGFDAEHFCHVGVGNRLYLRNFLDGELATELPRLLTENLLPAPGRDGVWMGTTEWGVMWLGSVGGGGHPCLAIPSNSGVGLVTGKGTAFVRSQYGLDVHDARTGVKLQFIPTNFSGLSPFSAAGELMGVVTDYKTLSLYSAASPVPLPETLAYTREERVFDSSWKLNLSETADFPVTVRLVSDSADVVVTSPEVTIPSGQRGVTMPLIVVDDATPEELEKVKVTLEISGNGKSLEQTMTITIPANQYDTLPKPPKKEVLKWGNSVALHPSGLVVASVAAGVAVDGRYKKTYKDGGAGYGRAVACGKDLMAVAAVDSYDPKSAGKVTVYDRKSGKAVKSVSGSAGTAFGATLLMGDKHLFVGAPGLTKPGAVTVLELKSGKTFSLQQPGKTSASNRFGSAIASLGDRVWIGAPRSGGGQVYQFNLKTKKMERVINPPASKYRDFGNALTVAGGCLVVGAPAVNANAALFTYNPNTGKLLATVPTPFADGGNFAASLATSLNDVIVAGCPASSFSRGGGLFLYQVKAGKPGLITMLRPDDDGLVKGMGIAGGLAAADTIVGVVVGGGLSETDLLAKPVNNLNPKANFFDIGGYLKARASATPEPLFATITPPLSNSPWEKALGTGASAADCAVQPLPPPSGPAVSLPGIASLQPGTRLILEASPDLLAWKGVAKLEGGDVPVWISISESVTIDPLASRADLAEDLDAKFFRIRCEVP